MVKSRLFNSSNKSSGFFFGFQIISTSRNIVSSNGDKKERLNVDEVNINNEQILINRDNVLNSLNSFCDEMNDLFGLEMYASFNNRVVKSDAETVVDELFDWGEDDEINI